MKRLLCLILPFCLTTPAFAGDPAKRGLSPKQVEEGWLLLFDGETTFGWKGPLLASNPDHYGPVGTDAKVEAGILRLGGDQEVSLWSSLPFGDFQLELEYRLESKATALLALHFRRDAVPGGGHGFVRAEADGWYRCSVTARGDPAGGTFTTHRKHFSPSGALLHESSGVRKSSDAVRIGFRVQPGGKFLLRSAKLKPLGLNSIFNGKDLTGWKEFPGQKSKFGVTPEGWLNVKNGRGDLQTVDKWADFTLQLECISNGDFLNSGIFFRCQPDKYQQGYEAQIHNKFLKQPKTYVLEDFDPKTHQSLGKRKAPYLADDYGTGAIYRRIPARKQMAKDREWFGMTVIAEGRHMGVWVNGVMVTDWTDNRPDNDNGRNGYRAAAGPISIQGHDPTTDLSFRNLRIAELPKGR